MISDLNIRIDRDLCYACGICADRCIMDNLRVAVGPCRQSCPIQMNCQGYLRLLAQGREEEAAREMRAASPFAAILGRVCTRPCEAVCERAPIDGAVHIRALKRYLSDSFPEVAFSPPRIEKETGLKAAVVGSGPAGLTAAYELRRRGHSVTVLEAQTEPGGLLRYAIPSFRLPGDQVSQAVEVLARMGVVFKTGLALGRDTDLGRLEEEFGAVVLALGAGPAKELRIPGQELEGVFQGLDLLRRFKEGESVPLGRSVAVIGGGSSAVDSALVSLLMGAEEVRLVSLEERSLMPASEEELKEAVEQGVILENGWGPTGLSRATGGGIRVELSRCLSLWDQKGRFRPCLEPACGLVLEVDSLVVAIGQEAPTSGLPQGLTERLTDPGTGLLAADPLTRQAASGGGLFAAGDCHTGPGSVVEAMASGREAAVSADRCLRDEGLGWGRDLWTGSFIRDYQADAARAKGGPRRWLERESLQGQGPVREMEKPLTGDQARQEAERCLSCGRAAEVNQTCWYCLPCEIECPVQALEVRMPYQVR